MKTYKLINKYTVLVVFILFFSCEKKRNQANEPLKDYDTKSVLTHWVDNFIIPYYDEFSNSYKTFKESAKTFIKSPDKTKLESLRVSFRKTYIAFQKISMFDIKHAGMIRYRSYMNTYPCNIDQVIRNIDLAGTDFEGVKERLNKYSKGSNKRNEQGLPAVDFLINGLKDDDADIINEFKNKDTYGEYLSFLVDKMDRLTKEVSEKWKSGQRKNFIENNVSSNSGSLNMTVNSFIYYFEKFLRSGKVAFAIGKFGARKKEGYHRYVEARFDTKLPKELLKKAIVASKDFFNGKGANEKQGPSLKQLIEYLKAKTKNGEDRYKGKSISDIINIYLDEALETTEKLDDNFSLDLGKNKAHLKKIFSDMQWVIISMKIDMVQAMSIPIDYKDTDGD